MTVLGKEGREIELGKLSGEIDDIQALDACYADNGDTITDEEYEYVMEAYAEDIRLAWMEQKID